MRISVIIPTLNEAETIAETLAQVRQAGDCEVIVVDGGSDDGTIEAVETSMATLLTTEAGRSSRPRLLPTQSGHWHSRKNRV